MPKKILLVAAELAGAAPIGGVAEYILGLASSLQTHGHDVRIALPRYNFLVTRFNPETVLADLLIWPGHVHEHRVDVLGFSVPNLTDPNLQLPVVLLGRHWHFDAANSSDDVYRGPGIGPEPWEEFSRAVADYAMAVDNEWRPDVIHCNDGHSALVPVFVSQLKQQGSWLAPHCRTVLTVHNLTYQGSGGNDRFWHAGLDDMAYGTIFGHYGQTNAFKAGLIMANMVSTVSYTYMNEICDSSLVGFGLEGVLGDLRIRGRLRGIVNGINERKWRIEGLPYYRATEDADLKDQRAKILAAKKKAKKELIKELGWPASDINVPIVSARSRWDEQKGFYTLIDSLEGLGKILEKARVLFVTWAEPNLSEPVPYDHPYPEPVHRSRHYWGTLLGIAERNPGRIKVNPSILTGTANLERHYLATDFFAVPSRFEPCGLIQMECQRYGTIPIVRRTGGLADTVSENVTIAYPSPNGYTYENYHWGDLNWAVQRAVDRYHRFVSGRGDDHDYHGWMIDNALQQQNSWDVRIPQYESLYGFSGT